MPNPQIVVEYLARTQGLNQAGDEVKSASGKVAGATKKAFLPAAVALGAIAAGAIDATKAAVEDAAAQDKLAGQLQRTTGATDEQVKSAEDYISALSMQVGIADDELRPALGKLATATGDVESAQKALALATDISAQTGKSLDSVTTALAKGYGGNTAALGKLVPGLDKGVLASKDMTKVTAELARLTGGAAAEAADTNAGKMRVMSVQMDETKEAIGAGLIPVMDALLPIIQDMSKFAAENTTVIKILVGVVAAFAAIIVTANIAMKVWTAVQLAAKAATLVWTAAQWLLNAALAANPIGLVVIAIAALVAALVTAYKTSDTFRKIVDAAFDAVVTSAKTAFNWIKTNWPLLLGILTGPFGLAIVLIVKNWDRIEQGARDAVNGIKTAMNGLMDFLNGIVERVSGVANRIANAIKAPINAIIGAWNNLEFRIPKVTLPKIKVLGKTFGGGGFGPFTFDFPDIPKLAAGGIVTAPTLAMIGESGPEAVIPLGSSPGPIEVRVFIGDTELKSLVRSEVRTADNRTAQVLLSGGFL